MNLKKNRRKFIIIILFQANLQQASIQLTMNFFFFFGRRKWLEGGDRRDFLTWVKPQ